MTTLDSIVESLRHSPRLPEVVSVLQRQLDQEHQNRQEFYDEMTPDQKVEFIDGETVLHSPARNQHLGATRRIATLLSAHVNVHKLGTVNIEKCLCVFPRNDYEPDVVFFGIEKSGDLLPGTLKFPVPDLIVEVLSDSTEERDRGVKFEDYATNGVTEYWIVNADKPFIEQYAHRSGTFELLLKASSGRLKSEAVNGFEIEIEAIFDEKANLNALRDLLG